jgi:hypothetical protein
MIGYSMCCTQIVILLSWNQHKYHELLNAAEESWHIPERQLQTVALLQSKSLTIWDNYTTR